MKYSGDIKCENCGDLLGRYHDADIPQNKDHWCDKVECLALAAERITREIPQVSEIELLKQQFDERLKRLEQKEVLPQ